MTTTQYTAELILSKFNGIDFPDERQDDKSLVTVLGNNGWKAVLFYDCGELDYVDSVVDPNGIEIDFWRWKPSEDRDKLIAWR